MTKAAIDELRWNLAVANRILAKQKVVDAFGHVSQRSPLRDDRFFISRSIAPGIVTPEDIVELDLDGANVDAGAPASYIERFIHSEIYRARPEVMSIVHSHSPSVLPFSVVRNVTLQCICHTAGFIGESTPVFEIRDFAGDATDLLIRDSDLGAALAQCLGDRPLVLMRGHGSTAVGATLAQAVYHAVYAEINARIQCEAIKLGPVTYLSSGEARAASQSASAVDRAWNMWAAEVERDFIGSRVK